jgi:tetratricopeptide (TPR) repeat protein
MVLKQLLNLEEAIKCYKKAIEIEPNLWYAHFNLANALTEMKNYHESLIHFDKALQLNPNNIYILNNKGAL